HRGRGRRGRRRVAADRPPQRDEQRDQRARGEDQEARAHQRSSRRRTRRRARRLCREHLIARPTLPQLGGGGRYFFATFLNLSVMRSLSPIAAYFALSVSPSRKFGASVHTPLA